MERALVHGGILFLFLLGLAGAGLLQVGVTRVGVEGCVIISFIIGRRIVPVLTMDTYLHYTTYIRLLHIHAAMPDLSRQFHVDRSC